MNGTSSLADAAALVMGDHILTREQKRDILSVLYNSTDGVKGILTTGDVVRGAIGAGIGSLTAKYLGTVLGGTFHMSPQTLSKLQTTGAFAGMLRGSGLWR